MSTRLALGAAGALAGLAALSSRGSRQWAAAPGLSAARRRDFDALAQRYRDVLERSERWGKPAYDLNEWFAREERRRFNTPIEFLGVGRDRSVFRVPEGALKLEHHQGRGVFNLLEHDFYTRAPDRLRSYLVPVLDIADDGSWSLMEEVEVAPRFHRLPRDVEESLHDCGLGDYGKGTNLSLDGRIVDYSYVRSQADRERCLRGGVSLDALLSAQQRWQLPGWEPTMRTPSRVRGAHETLDPADFMVSLGQTAPLPGSSNRETRTWPLDELAATYRFVIHHNTAERTISARAYLRRTGERVGHAGMIRSYGAEACEEQVEALVRRMGARLPEGATRRPPYVAVSGIEREHRGRGLGVLLYKLAMQAWFDAYGPTLVIPMRCTIGSGTSGDADRVWASLCRELPCEYPAVAVVEAISGLDGLMVRHKKKHQYKW